MDDDYPVYSKIPTYLKRLGWCYLVVLFGEVVTNITTMPNYEWRGCSSGVLIIILIVSMIASIWPIADLLQSPKGPLKREGRCFLFLIQFALFSLALSFTLGSEPCVSYLVTKEGWLLSVILSFLFAHLLLAGVNLMYHY